MTRLTFGLLVFALTTPLGAQDGPAQDEALPPAVREAQAVVLAAYPELRAARIAWRSTADAIRNELRTGQPTKGHWHSEQGEDSIRALETWLADNPTASYSDRVVAQSLLSTSWPSAGG